MNNNDTTNQKNQSCESPILQCISLSKCYTDADINVEVFSDLNLSIAPGEVVGILGVSGSGKSSLLHLMAGLDTPTSGDVCLGGHSITKMSESKLSRLRNLHLGFIYQFHHLLPEFNALENVCMPLLIRGLTKKEAVASARDIISKVGLANRELHKIGELSGGERQRIAIARAMVVKPKCILADEPTGNLDAETAATTFDLLLQLNKSFNTSLVIVTHNKELVSNADRVLLLRNGMLQSLSTGESL